MNPRLARSAVLILAMAAMLAAAPAASAAPVAAVVEAVQMPAWVERDGQRSPLLPGMRLRAGDRLQSGGGARIQVRLTEGSRVKLGENATLELVELDPGRRLFRAAMHLLEGAFRFTTDLAARSRHRQVSVAVANVTIGIRGTDVWGRTGDGRQVVCLLEGAVQVGAPGESALTLDQPRQFYQRDQGKALPVGFIAPDQLAKWAKSTEIEPGAGAARRGGKWSVELLRGETQEAAFTMYEQVRKAGYGAEIYPAKAHGKRIYLVRISHLASKADAETLAKALRALPSVGTPRVTR